MAPLLITSALVCFFLIIDVWSSGCVMAELMLGQPLFPGESGVDQLVEIIKILGTPTREQIKSMNQNYTEYKFPQIKASPWSKVDFSILMKGFQVSGDNPRFFGISFKTLRLHSIPPPNRNRGNGPPFF